MIATLTCPHPFTLLHPPHVRTTCVCACVCLFFLHVLVARLGDPSACVGFLSGLLVEALLGPTGGASWLRAQRFRSTHFPVILTEGVRGDREAGGMVRDGEGGGSVSRL